MRQFQGIKDLENSITGYWIVVIFVHAKIDKIVIFGKKLNHIILATCN
jgi:hypothetical protein